MVMPKATADDPSLMVCEWSTVILEENTRIQICFIIVKSHYLRQLSITFQLKCVFCAFRLSS